MLCMELKKKLQFATARYKQMPLTGQITALTLHVRSFFRLRKNTGQGREAAKKVSSTNGLREKITNESNIRWLK